MALPRIVAGPRRRLMARLLANGFAQAGAAFGIAWLVREALAGGHPSLAVIAGLVASGFGMLALRALERVDAERLGQDYVMKVRLRLFERIARRPSRDEQSERFGLTMTRLVTDLNALRNWVSVGVARMAVACVSMAGVLATLAYFDRVAALIVSGVILLCALVAIALTPYLRSRVREARRRRGKLAGNLGEKIFAFATVRHHGRTRQELKRLRRQSRQMTEALVLRMRAAGVLRSLPDAAFPLTAAALVVILAWRSGGGAAGSELVVTLLLLGMLMASLRDLLTAWDYRLSFEEGRRRIEEILAGPRVLEAGRARPLPGDGPVPVALRGVAVEGALRRVSASADAGERVLVTGAAGAGKSTLLALLARLFDPDAGEVRLGGKPLRKLSLDSVEDAVRLVSPELPLLRGTVRTNLAYGGDDEASDRLVAAATLCRLHPSGPGLPEGLDSPVREKGVNLAASVRSRVSLARALASSPRLLLIDDPIFFSDEAARAVLDAVLAASDATVLVVGPEPSALPNADRVWRLERGRLRESRRSGDSAPEIRAVSAAPSSSS